MCLALEQIKEDSKTEGEREGRIIGAIEAYRDIGIQKPVVVKYIADALGRTTAEAQGIVEQYWKRK